MDDSIEHKKMFAFAMARLRRCYPHFKPTDDNWKSLMREYFYKLIRYPLDSVYDAIGNAHKTYHTYFPTVGQLELLVMENKWYRLWREKKKKEEFDRLEKKTVSDEPVGPRLPSDHPMEKLAREWELSPPSKEGAQLALGDFVAKFNQACEQAERRRNEAAQSRRRREIEDRGHGEGRIK